MPTSLRLTANDLTHHVLEWLPAADAGPRPASAPRTVLLVHGFMDAAGTWDAVAPALAAAGYRVLAPDMRGFGEGPRAAYYHFVDYVFDLADLVDALSPGEPVALVGHSMGGTIVTMTAGAIPERVARLVTLEGLGPPDNPPEAAPIRMRSWIDQVRATRARVAKVATFTREEALARLAANHPRVPREVLETRLPHLTSTEEGDRLAWRFDPLHRTTSPMPFFTSVLVAYAKRVTCPVLYVSGGPTGYHPPDEDARIAAFADVTSDEIPDAGHMMHWTKPAETAAKLLAFLALAR